MLKKLSKKLTMYAQKLIVIARIKRIRQRDFTIIASNCTGTLPYRFLNIPYNSPTINLYFLAPDYLRFVKRLDHYLAQPLKFVQGSRYPEADKVHSNSGHYPIGVLDDIEIHFMHYQDEAEAEAKWNRRKLRINRDRLVFAFTDKDLCNQQLLEEFDALPLRNKFVFTAGYHPDIKCSIQVNRYAGESEIGDTYTNYDALAHVNFSRLIDKPKSHSAAVSSASRTANAS